MKMGERKETCIMCRKQLLVPPTAKVLRCMFCGTINPVQPLVPTVDFRVQEPVRQASKLFKGIFNGMPNTFLSVNTYQGSTAVPAHSYTSCPPPDRLIPPASSYRRRKAVLCGVRYRSKSYELEGTIHDVNCMKYFLVQKLGFPISSIYILTEDEKDPSRIPTKQNIRAALQWLIHDCRSGDSLVFHYSGHGSQQPNYCGNEKDGYDETLCPLDYETKGMILDDEINEIIVRPLPKGATLHAIIDSCHSGTVLDLPYLCKINQLNGYFHWENQIPTTGEDKGNSGGLALCISACADHESSVDTSAMSSNGTMTGALTYSFIQAMENSHQKTYGFLLNSVQSMIRDSSRRIRLNGPIGSFLNKVLFTGIIRQEPQLSSSKMFDIYTEQLAM